MKINKFVLALATYILGCTTNQSDAAITVVAPTATTQGSLQISSVITFTITTSGSWSRFVLVNWLTSDGQTNLSQIVSGGLSVSINNRSYFLDAPEFADNANTTIGSIAPNDGYFRFLPSRLSPVLGDTVSIHARNYGLWTTTGFNPQANQTFTGSMFITDYNGNRISNIISVPEPSTVGLSLCGITVVLTLIRSRK